MNGEARLGITTSGQFEVELFDESGNYVLRRHVETIEEAKGLLDQPATEPVRKFPEPTEYRAMDRNEAISRIKKALKERSGKAWSVTGGRGTAWGWISISSPPKRRLEFGYMTEADCAELGELLGLGKPVHSQGESIPASSDYRDWYVARAEGRDTDVKPTPYWD